MNKIDFLEIENWEVFEDLAAAYFREIPSLENNNLTEVIVEPAGKGPDGGRDILLKFRLNDSILPFEKRWVVQCKFLPNLLKSNLDKINIPTLIKEYDADGYLLICKESIHVGVTNTFEKLRTNCRDKFEYEFWNGNQFKERLYKTESLQEHYFPKFFKYRSNKEINSNLKEIFKK